MENNNQFRFGDEVWYASLNTKLKRWECNQGKIIGQKSATIYVVKNTKLDLSANVEMKYIYRHKVNCIMDIGILNSEVHK